MITNRSPMRWKYGSHMPDLVVGAHARSEVDRESRLVRGDPLFELQAARSRSSARRRLTTTSAVVTPSAIRPGSRSSAAGRDSAMISHASVTAARFATYARPGGVLGIQRFGQARQRPDPEPGPGPDGPKRQSRDGRHRQRSHGDDAGDGRLRGVDGSEIRQAIAAVSTIDREQDQRADHPVQLGPITDGPPADDQQGEQRRPRRTATAGS